MDTHILNNDGSDASRIDAPVRRVSHWQIVVMAAYLLTLGLISLFIHVRWWIFILLVILSFMVLLWMYVRHSPLIHLTSPQLYHQEHNQQNQSHKLWQLLFDKPEHHELWEAKLVQCRDFGKCIQLNFTISHPMPETLLIMLWQDQLDAHSWRRLKALAKW
ncbi:hypothetical protein [Psychrobacter sp. I-STPA10]|uniref:hypothetical protein n=1 Tax=Psychrobacter sp. I-STPA10 TaxID=2585769 RepID=UPI001E56473A|nr:hypothetical protein [Psychrobacter sp. I-STPA10]